MRVYFVRHGESEENVTDIYQGAESPLSDLGYEQAAAIAERFTTIPTDLIIASTMVRAKETARVISEKVGQGVVHSDLFVESNAPSELLGKHFEDPDSLDVRIAWLEKRFTDEHARYSDEETVADLKVRAKKALEFIRSKDSDDILVVTHGTFLRVILGTILEGNDFSPQVFKRYRQVLSFKNTGITVCEYAAPPDRNDQLSRTPDGSVVVTQEPIWRILTLNDHAHLG